MTFEIKNEILFGWIVIKEILDCSFLHWWFIIHQFVGFVQCAISEGEENA